MEYKIQRQLTVALENVPGRLAAICQTIGAHEINIEGICIIDNIEQGVIRLITSQPAEAKRLLTAQGIYIVEADVLTIEVTDQFGTLGRLSASFAAQNINIDYLYATSHQTGAITKLVFKVSDLAGAQRVLGALEVD